MKYLLLTVIAAFCVFGSKAQVQDNNKVNPDQAFQVSAFAGANSQTSKDFGVEAVWKKNVHRDLFINSGLSIGMD